MSILHGEMGRRGFLRTISSATAATVVFGQVGPAAEESPSAMPTIQLGRHTISRIVAGYNPTIGSSHSTLDLRRAMLEYFTLENTVAFLASCEQNGITAWQFDHAEKSVAAIRQRREQGTKMKFICLHAERQTDAPIRKVVEDTAPIAMVHHGWDTDARFREGKQDRIRDYLKKIHDQGLLAGVSSHYPEHIRRIADENWECDFFMCCFYCVFRTKEEQMKLMGRTIVHESYLENDPIEMTKVIREVKQPCLGFKILAAGRHCWSSPSINRAFKFAFSNIKAIDGVIVGMFPRYADEVAEDAERARTFGAIRPS